MLKVYEQLNMSPGKTTVEFRESKGLENDK